MKNQIFSFENLTLNTKDLNKWYVGYSLIFADGSKTHRREYGKNRYQISLTKEKNLVLRKQLGEKLLGLVNHDLSQGIDPQFRNEILDARNLEKLEQAKIDDSKKIDIDTAIQLVKDEKGWNNPVEGKERTASSLLSFYNNQLKAYFHLIKKDDDIRQVTKSDLKKFIEAHFNPTPESGYNNWGAHSCKIYRGHMSILFETLLNLELVENNPASGIKIKKDNEKIKPDGDVVDRFPPWTADELNKWFGDLENSDKPIEKVMYITSMVIHYGFIRKSELLRLRAWMIDLDNERFTLPARILKSARKYAAKDLIYIDMPDALVVALKNWMAYVYPNGFGDDDYLFPNVTVKKGITTIPYVYSTFTKNFKELRAVFQTKYDGLFIDKNQYALKHNGVIKLFKSLTKSRRTPQEIQSIVKNHCRHSSFKTTEDYLRGLNLEFDGVREKVNF